jgi:1,4-alpha-glucan branching enzyme
MRIKPKGYFALVLHAHLPFVRHPEYDHFMEENWLFEAITETYLPLLDVLENITRDKVPCRLTMSVTAPLCHMLSDDLLKERYLRYIDRCIALAEKETVRVHKDECFSATASMYLEKFIACKNAFVNEYRGDLTGAFKRLEERGTIEIIASGATHGFLPNMQINPLAARAQIKLGVESHIRFFNKRPAGIWLPECGYFPGLEKILDEEQLRYFFTDTHGVLFADPRPKYGVYAPVYCGNTHVAAFGRDIESSTSVWSSRQGYPGDFDYRDFYRDIGFDLDIDYLRPYIDPVGIPMSTGIKYYRITGPSGHKEPYHYQNAIKKAAMHAGNFIFNREKQIEYLASLMDRPPVVAAPYDAELFGHWWYEGPHWLNYLIRKTAFEQDTFSLITCSDYLAMQPVNQICTPSFSSWGENGYARVWLDSSNDWIYRHIHSMEACLIRAAKENPEADRLKRRALNQMARELLMAQASDWAFIMKMGTMVQYAVKRTKEHIANFNRLSDDINNNSIDSYFVSLLESHTNIFPDIDYRIYAGR